MAYQTFRQEYMQMPVVTRAYTTACVITTLAVVRVKFVIKFLIIAYLCVFRSVGSYTNSQYLYFQQLDLVSPFQLYFNPILIVKQYQVYCVFYTRLGCSGYLKAKNGKPVFVRRR